MKWIQMPLGPLQTNAYILKNDKMSVLSLILVMKERSSLHIYKKSN